MITKMNIKKSLLIFAGLLTIVFLAGLASAVTLANWNFEAENLVPSTDITSSAVLNVSNADGTQNFTTGNPSSGKALHYDNWDAGDYFELTLNNLGYKDVVLKFDEQKSASTGPTEFKIQYSTDGANFTDLASSTTNTSSSFSTNPMHTFAFSSITALNNISSAKFRIFVTQNASSTVGTWRIDNLAVEGTSLTAPVPTWQSNFCLFDDGEGSNPGELDVKIKDVNAVGFGDGNEVLPFDTLEIEVSVDNQGSDNIDNIEVEWGLYDSDTGDWVIDVDNEKDFDLKDGNDETITFSFDINDNMDVDLSDLDESDNYVLYVRATGDVDNNNNDITCESDTEDIQLIIEKDFVVAKDITAPETVSCNSDLQVSADIWNIGTRNQDNVVVKIFNKDLSINKLVEVGDIDSFDNTNLDETFKIPSNAKEQSYSISFEIYDDSDDIYVNDYDDQEARFTKAIKVTSCSGITDDGAGEEGNILVSAEIQDGGEAGKPLIIKAVVTNTGDSSATLLLNAAGYSSWAESVNVVPESITLAAGKSASALLTFEVNKDASGDNLFDLEIVSGNNLVAVQPVSVSITENKGGFSLGGSWYLWLIVALNVILVIVIIAIAVKVSKKK